MVFDDAGRQVAMAQREWSHRAVAGVPGSQIFDTATNWQLICQCIRQVLTADGIEASAIRAVSTTSMREGMVLYDEAGREIWACPNVDSRASAEAGELVQSGQAERIYRSAGDWVAITAPARLRWIQQHERDVFEATRHLGMLADWIAFRLCGEYFTDPSMGSSSGMFDLATRTWSPEIIEICGMDAAVFPDVLEPGQVAGVVTSQAATETGLKAGLPVVVGGADTQLGLVGIGLVDTGKFTIIGGTFWQQTIGLSTAAIDPQARLRTLCHALPGQWMMEGIGFYCGLTMRWFRDAFCEHEKEQAARDGTDAYSLMEAAARDVPAGSNGVFGIFSNLMVASRWIHASPAFMQFDIGDPARSGRKECIRAIEEAAAYVSNGHLKVIQEVTGLTCDEVVFTGGASKGELWPQILADVLGLPVVVPRVKESTALGAAIFAGVGAGLFADASAAAKQVVSRERTLEPDAANHERYRTLYGDWVRLYQRQVALVEDGLLAPLWRAAGT